MVTSAKLISGSLLRAFQTQPSPDAWFWGSRSRTSPARGGSHPAGGGGKRLPGRAAAWSQLKSTPSPWNLPSAVCSPALPGPSEPDPISGLTSWTSLHNPVLMALHVYPRAVSDPVHLTGSDTDAIAPSTSAIPENVQFENLCSSVLHMCKTTFINSCNFSKTVLQTCLSLSDKIAGPGFTFSRISSQNSYNNFNQNLYKGD